MSLQRSVDSMELAIRQPHFTAGYASARVNSQQAMRPVSFLGNLSTPEINIEGTGTLDVSQVWNATGASNLISYTQTGGTANFRLMGENHAGAVLSLDNINTVFNMSGGHHQFHRKYIHWWRQRLPSLQHPGTTGKIYCKRWYNKRKCTRFSYSLHRQYDRSFLQHECHE